MRDLEFLWPRLTLTLGSFFLIFGNSHHMEVFGLTLMVGVIAGALLDIKEKK